MEQREVAISFQKRLFVILVAMASNVSAFVSPTNEDANQFQTTANNSSPPFHTLKKAKNITQKQTNTTSQQDSRFRSRIFTSRRNCSSILSYFFVIAYKTPVCLRPLLAAIFLSFLFPPFSRSAHSTFPVVLVVYARLIVQRNIAFLRRIYNIIDERAFCSRNFRMVKSVDTGSGTRYFVFYSKLCVFFVSQTQAICF